MNHKQLIVSFRNILQRSFKVPYFFYKIPDTVGLGGIRPFDAFLLVNGLFFAIEFKMKTDRIKKHQAYYLKKVEECGGIPLIIEEGKINNAINAIIILMGMKR